MSKKYLSITLTFPEARIYLAHLYEHLAANLINQVAPEIIIHKSSIDHSFIYFDLEWDTKKLPEKEAQKLIYKALTLADLVTEQDIKHKQRQIFLENKELLEEKRGYITDIFQYNVSSISELEKKMLQMPQVTEEEMFDFVAYISNRPTKYFVLNKLFGVNFVSKLNSGPLKTFLHKWEKHQDKEEYSIKRAEVPLKILVNKKPSGKNGAASVTLAVRVKVKNQKDLIKLKLLNYCWFSRLWITFKRMFSVYVIRPEIKRLHKGNTLLLFSFTCYEKDIDNAVKEFSKIVGSSIHHSCPWKEERNRLIEYWEKANRRTFNREEEVVTQWKRWRKQEPLSLREQIKFIKSLELGDIENFQQGLQLNEHVCVVM